MIQAFIRSPQDGTLGLWASEATLSGEAHWYGLTGKASSLFCRLRWLCPHTSDCFLRRKALCTVASSHGSLHSGLSQTPDFGKGKRATRERFRPFGLQLRLWDHEGGLSRSGTGCYDLTWLYMTCVMGEVGVPVTQQNKKMEAVIWGLLT